MVPPAQEQTVSEPTQVPSVLKQRVPELHSFCVEQVTGWASVSVHRLWTSCPSVPPAHSHSVLDLPGAKST